MDSAVSPRRQAWRLFLEVHARLLPLLSQELEQETGLPLTWYDVLAHLAGAPECGLRLQELGRSLLISKSGLTRRIDRMEEAGLVQRRDCPEDRRGAFAALTPLGREAFTRAVPVHLRGVRRRFTDQLDDTEARVMAPALAEILAHLPPDASASEGCE